ncbi:MAG: sarcosine oxidase subunit delta [Actinomycetota bacterium]
MSMRIPCPNCGSRPYTEYSYGGELRAIDADSLDEDFRRVYLRENADGPQRERWFHAAGCRRWLTLTRDTVTNRIDDETADPSASGAPGG